MVSFSTLVAFQALLCWLSLVKADEEICPGGWTFMENVNRCYKYLPTPVSWDVALRKCNRQNATLPTILDRKINDAISEFTGWRYYAFFHIGLRQASSGEWQWVDGSPLDYANWKGNGPPNNNERPSRVNEHRVAGWFALDCDYTEWPTVCEQPALKHNDGNDQLKTTDVSGGSTYEVLHISLLAFTSTEQATTTTANAADTTTPTEQDRSTATTAGTKPVKEACTDKASAWKCKSLTAIYACKAGAYFKYLEENCAWSCGFCN